MSRAGGLAYFCPSWRKNCLSTFQQGPHGAVSTRELRFFPFPLFGLSFTPASYLAFFLRCIIFSLWVRLDAILHSLFRSFFLFLSLSLSLQHHICGAEVIGRPIILLFIALFYSTLDCIPTFSPCPWCLEYADCIIWRLSNNPPTATHQK